MQLFLSCRMLLWWWNPLDLYSSIMLSINLQIYCIHEEPTIHSSPVWNILRECNNVSIKNVSEGNVILQHNKSGLYVSHFCHQFYQSWFYSTYIISQISYNTSLWPVWSFGCPNNCFAFSCRRTHLSRQRSPFRNRGSNNVPVHTVLHSLTVIC